MHFHLKLLHSGAQSSLASIRQHFWPIGGRKYVASVISKCLRCYKMKPQLSRHIMGSLPAERVQPTRAFTTTEVDFCGHFFYESGVRNIKGSYLNRWQAVCDIQQWFWKKWSCAYLNQSIGICILLF